MGAKVGAVSMTQHDHRGHRLPQCADAAPLTDEMTGVQALERAAPDLPMQPGKGAQREFEYVRHGTQTLIAAFDVVSGKVIGIAGNTRTGQDYVSFLESLFATATPTTRGRGVADNLNTHVSESVVRLVVGPARLADLAWPAGGGVRAGRPAAGRRRGRQHRTPT